MVWPYLLGGAALLMAAGLYRKDSLCAWVAGLGGVGVLAMQAPIEEPWRWLYAFALWSLIPALTAFHVRGGYAALAFLAIPVGYFGLAFEIGPAWLMYSATEIPWVVALLIGGRGVLTHVGSHLRDTLRRGNRFLAWGRESNRPMDQEAGP